MESFDAETVGPIGLTGSRKTCALQFRSGERKLLVSMPVEQLGPLHAFVLAAQDEADRAGEGMLSNGIREYHFSSAEEGNLVLLDILLDDGQQLTFHMPSSESGRFAEALAAACDVFLPKPDSASTQ